MLEIYADIKLGILVNFEAVKELCDINLCDGIGKLRNSKLYEPQTKNCITWTHSTYVLFTVIFNYREFNISYIYIYPNLISIKNHV